MAVYYKPQSPIQSGEDFIYPITTADQIMKSDKTRRLEQAGLIVADNSTSLGGVAAKDYALKTDTAPDSNKLGGKSPEYYLQPRNLFDNGDFTNPVNQRGINTAANNSYIIDRWSFHNSNFTGNVTIRQSANGITITNDAGADTVAIVQKFIDKSYYDDKYTVVVKTTNGLVFGYTETSDSENGIAQASIWLPSGTTVVWAALYEGTYTAETLPPYVPKGYAVELAACNSAPVDLGGGYGGGSLQAYPVGSIYMSVNSTSPASLFGGTWEQIKGRFLLACGDNGDGWNYSPGSIGGEPAHILTVNEMPSHTHVIYRNIGTDDNNFSGHIANRVAANDTSDENKQTVTSDATGGGGAHNNLPPYLAVYMWKRVS